MDLNEKILLARMDERQQHMDEKMDAILLQVRKTNGRVDEHDSAIGNLQRAQSEAIGFAQGSWKTTVAIAGGVAFIASIVITYLTRNP